MKVTIEGTASFHVDTGVGDDLSEVEVTIVGAPDEDLDDGQVLIIHPKFSLELNLRELERALRPFERRPRGAS
jgi:hypothetical protein